VLGILVHGENHFIVRGPLPERTSALALVQHWSVIQIGAKTPPHLALWTIVSKAFREDLAWAVVVSADSEISPAVCELLEELRERGVVIHDHQA
jgi:hypothetical protein